MLSEPMGKITEPSSPVKSAGSRVVNFATAVAFAFSPSTAFPDVGDNLAKGIERQNLEQKCDKVTVTSQDFVTGNMLIDWLGHVNSARISSPTNYAREFITIERGTDNKVLYVNVPAHKKVQVAHHLNWTLNPAKARPGLSFQVQLSPQNIDYVLVHNGDKYIIDTQKMRGYNAETAQRLGRHISAMAAGNNCAITVDRKSLDAHISKRYGSQAKDIRSAVAKAGDESLAVRYNQMSDTEVMARHVPETLAESMYKDAAKIGVTIEDVRTVAAEGRKIEGTRFVSEYNPNAPGIEFAVWGKRTADKERLAQFGLDPIYNHGLLPFTPEQGYHTGSRLNMTEEQLTKLIGEDKIQEMRSKRVEERMWTNKGLPKLWTRLLVKDWKSDDLCKTLAENTVMYDINTMTYIGKATPSAFPLKAWHWDTKVGTFYQKDACGLMNVNQLK